MGTSQAPKGYQPTGQPQADTNFQNLVSNANPYVTTALQTIPTLQQLATNIQNDPYNLQALQGAQQAAQYGVNTLAPQQEAGATNLSQLSALGLPAAQSVLQTGFDPQQQLYNQLQQQNQQQQSVINAQGGVASTPYGAGVTGQSNQNFNINWQNNQLARQLQALQGYNSAAGTAAGAAQAGSNLGQSALGTLTAASNAPAQTYASQQEQGLGAFLQMLSGVNSAFQPTQMLTGDEAQYLGIGQNATGLAQNASKLNNDMWNSIFGDVLGAADVGSQFLPDSWFG